jgi:dephospho-CoA kinase
VADVPSILKVALTGAIATGKSYVLEQFERRGVSCLDADILAHDVTATGTEAASRIVARFGADMLDDGGAVDRRKLGRLVFENAEARRDLEAIVHPAVYRSITAWIRALELVGDTALAVVDVPLLYETGRAGDFDRVIATWCPIATQEARLVERGLTREEARQRIAAQLSADEKAARADHVIRTTGSFEDTNQQVEAVLRSLKEEAGRLQQVSGNQAST